MIEMIEDAPLTLQSRAALALNSTQAERDLRELAAKNAHIVAVIDKPGRMQAHSAAMELKSARVTINNTASAAREDATQFQKAVIAEAKRLVSIVESEEARLIGLRDAFDDEQVRIKAEAEAAERARVTAIHERIAAIRSYLQLAAQCRTAARVDELLIKLVATPQGNFEEFAEEAATVLAGTIQAITAIYDERTAEEAERARLKAEGEAAAARLAVQRAEQEAEARRLAEERAAMARERAELEAAKAAARQAIEDAKPKVDPAAEFEQALQAFAAEVAPVVIDGPVVMSGAMKAQFEKTFAPEAWNPSDMQILDALCQHFGKSERLVFNRLTRGIDLVALQAACFDEVSA
jgi:hypothetical protein